jgi:hypothetical protein
MPLTPEDRKKKLGRGGLTKVAKKLGYTIGHIAEVNAGRRRDERVEQEIANRIVRKHPEISVEDVWPHTARVVAVAGAEAQ